MLFNNNKTKKNILSSRISSIYWIKKKNKSNKTCQFKKLSIYIYKTREEKSFKPILMLQKFWVYYKKRKNLKIDVSKLVVKIGQFCGILGQTFDLKKKI